MLITFIERAPYPMSSKEGGGGGGEGRRRGKWKGGGGGRNEKGGTGNCGVISTQPTLEEKRKKRREITRGKKFPIFFFKLWHFVCTINTLWLKLGKTRRRRCRDTDAIHSKTSTSLTSQKGGSLSRRRGSQSRVGRQAGRQ